MEHSKYDEFNYVSITYEHFTTGNWLVQDYLYKKKEVKKYEKW